METVKKFKGNMKGWNIRKTNDGKYYAYIGTTCQSLKAFKNINDCEAWIKNPNKYNQS